MGRPARLHRAARNELARLAPGGNLTPQRENEAMRAKLAKNGRRLGRVASSRAPSRARHLGPALASGASQLLTVSRESSGPTARRLSQPLHQHSAFASIHRRSERAASPVLGEDSAPATAPSAINNPYEQM